MYGDTICPPHRTLSLSSRSNAPISSSFSSAPSPWPAKTSRQGSVRVTAKTGGISPPCRQPLILVVHIITTTYHRSLERSSFEGSILSQETVFCKGFEIQRGRYLSVWENSRLMRSQEGGGERCWIRCGICEKAWHAPD